MLYYLFKDARPKSAEEEVEVRLLEGWVWLATRSKGDTEQALSRFMEMATSLVSTSYTPCRLFVLNVCV